MGQIGKLGVGVRSGVEPALLRVVARHQTRDPGPGRGARVLPRGRELWATTRAVGPSTRPSLPVDPRRLGAAVEMQQQALEDAAGRTARGRIRALSVAEERVSWRMIMNYAVYPGYGIDSVTSFVSGMLGASPLENSSASPLIVNASPVRHHGGQYNGGASTAAAPATAPAPAAGATPTTAIPTAARRVRGQKEVRRERSWPFSLGNPGLIPDLDQQQQHCRDYASGSE